MTYITNVIIPYFYGCEDSDFKFIASFFSFVCLFCMLELILDLIVDIFSFTWQYASYQVTCVPNNELSKKLNGGYKKKNSFDHVFIFLCLL
jgi:hypothetical protein